MNKEEISKYIIDNHDKLSITKMSKDLNCTIETIKNIGCQIGIFNRNQFSNSELKEKRLKFVKNHINDMTYKEMAKELNCNPATIGKYVNELGITKSEICINYKDEIWMNLEKYNYSKYWISNYGRIKNEDNIILKYQKREYPFIKLTNDVTGKRDPWYVHDLIAIIFIENDDPVHKTEVNHINGNKYDYLIDNLEWITPGDNQRHAYKIGLRTAQKGEQSCRTNYTNEEIKEICKLFSEGKSISQIIKLYNGKFTKSVLQKIKYKKTWKHISKDYNF